MTGRRVVVVGAGIAGLTAAVELSGGDDTVVVLEKLATAGGKMRELPSIGTAIDAGPTVLTMAHVFEDIFSRAGAQLADHVTLDRLEILARHAWPDGAILDLFRDSERTELAIAKFAGSKDAAGFRAFSARARSTYKTLEDSFIFADRPTPVSLALASGIGGLGDLWRISPFTTLWRALADHFKDERLQQLFGRYATYCGSSPFDAPATLMLVADVERQGVWTVHGGMQRLADALVSLAARRGVAFRFDSEVARIEVEGERVVGVVLRSGERIPADAVIFNADPAAAGSGLFGHEIAQATAPMPAAARSLSAITFTLTATTRGFPLHRHNVFFSRNYRREFDDIFRDGRVPTEPTVYICAEDRGDHYDPEWHEPERLLCLVNAPAIGDTKRDWTLEIKQCQERMVQHLTRCGLDIAWPLEGVTVTTPADFARLFPATGGALYGQASHGWTASFSRPQARTKIKGLYLAGGATHPGPGVPMAALSGMLAARALVADRVSPEP
ncbi:MAG: 1-hydroxycarotenoid 3,4-desaturase CrtD [Hyphomicrobium sp.]